MSRNDYQFAELSKQALEKIRETESFLNGQSQNEEIIVLAFKPGQSTDR